MKKIVLILILINSSFAQEGKTNTSTNLSYEEISHPADLNPAVGLKKNLLAGGDEGGGGSGGSSSGGGKISVASNDYENDMIAHGIECASSLGALVPDKKTMDSIAKSIEAKISSAQPSRAIASEHSQSCSIFSSQTSSTILKRKFIREEVLPASNVKQKNTGDSLSQ